MSASGGDDDGLVAHLVELAQAQGATIAVAESLTAGRVSARLGGGASASSWYRGAVVAYDEQVKFEVLGVTPGPVVTDSCAREMAVGVRRLLRADVGLGITGVGGPSPQEGRPPGTVHLAVSWDDRTWCREVHLQGDPAQVVASATSWSVEALVHALRERGASDPG